MQFKHPKLRKTEPIVKSFLSKYPIVEAFRKACSSNGLKSYVVGGVTRDLLMGADPTDVDIVTENLKSIQQLGEIVSSLGFGKPKEKGTFDKHFDLTCNGREFSFFRVENTYGGINKDKATVSDVVGAFDFSLNAFIISLQDFSILDPFGFAEATFDEPTLFIMTSNRQPFINNRARTILRGIKLAIKYPRVELDPLCFGWMQVNNGHLRKISTEDMDRILRGLNETERLEAMHMYYSTINFLRFHSHFKKVVSPKLYQSLLPRFTLRPTVLPITIDFFTVPFDYQQIIEDLGTNDTYFDTPDQDLAKSGALFRVREKHRVGSLSSAEISLRFERIVEDHGLISKRDWFVKLTRDQQLSVLSSMDPFSIESEEIISLKKFLTEKGIDIAKLRPKFTLSTETKSVVFESFQVPLYNPFSDSTIKTQIASNQGHQIEIRFNQTTGNGKIVYTIEFSDPAGHANKYLTPASAMIPGVPVSKTKLELIYGNIGLDTIQ